MKSTIRVRGIDTWDTTRIKRTAHRVGVLVEEFVPRLVRKRQSVARNWPAVCRFRSDSASDVVIEVRGYVGACDYHSGRNSRPVRLVESTISTAVSVI